MEVRDIATFCFEYCELSRAVVDKVSFVQALKRVLELRHVGVQHGCADRAEPPSHIIYLS